MSASWAVEGVIFDTSGATGLDGTTGASVSGGSAGGGSAGGGESSSAGTCAGMDDQGNNCPAEFDSERPCPPGCTSTPSSGSTANADSSSQGSCSGTDDQGQTCPPDFNSERPCPPGCTSVPSGSSASTPAGGSNEDTSSSSGVGSDSVALTYTTDNTAAYMCAAGLSTSGQAMACGQSEYPAGQNAGVEATVACES